MNVTMNGKRLCIDGNVVVGRNIVTNSGVHVTGSGNNFGITVNDDDGCNVISINSFQGVKRSGKTITVTLESHGKNPCIKINEDEKLEDDVEVTGDDFESLTVHRRVGHIQIRLANKIDGDVIVSNQSGQIDIDNLTVFGEFDVKTMSGEVELRKCGAKKDCTIKTMSGNIVCKKGNFPCRCLFKTMSGNISISDGINFHEPDKVTIKTMSGNIYLPRGLNVTKAKSMSGKVDVDINRSAPGIQVSTLSGNIKS